MVDAFATLAHYQVRKEKMKINNFPLVCTFRKLTKKLTNLSYPSNSHFLSCSKPRFQSEAKW